MARFAGALAILVLAAGAVSGGGDRSHRTHRMRAVARIHRVADAYDNVRFHPRVEAAREVLWIGQGSSHRQISAFDRYHPGIPAFLYKNALFADSSAHPDVPATSPFYPGGVSYAYIEARHPDWFLRDEAGNRMNNARHPSFSAVDIGNVAYQKVWAANAIHEAHRYGWSGIFADDLSCWPANLDGVPASYPTPSAWQHAAAGFLATVGGELHRARLKLISNSSSCAAYPAALRRFVAREDGVLEEGWMRSSTDPSESLASLRGGVWAAQLRELIDTERAGKYYLAELPAYPSDINAIRYGLATQLLVAEGKSSFDVSGAPLAYSRAFWCSDYNHALQLGPPSGPYYQVTHGVYRRDFSRGTVLVNPTGSTVVVHLDGTYSGSGLTKRTSAKMGPTSGLVLLAARRASRT